MTISLVLVSTDRPLGLRAHAAIVFGPEDGPLNGYELAGFKVWQAARGWMYRVTCTELVKPFWRARDDQAERRFSAAILQEYERAVMARAYPAVEA